jgi:TonB family protein
MTPFLIYQLKVGIALSLFMIFYHVFLRKETFYALNRFYLLAAMVLAQLTPLIRLPVKASASPRIFPYLIDPVVVTAGKTHFLNRIISDVGRLPMLQIVYCIIAAGLALYLIVQLVHLVALVKQRGYIRHGLYKIVPLSESMHSFSFFNYLFLSSSGSPEFESNPILEHELIHARQRHSLDILFLNILKIFQWFNPFFYILQKSVQETHEYLADAAVLEHDGDTDRYKMLLLSQVFGIQPGILSCFNYSLIKKRLTMMTKEKSPTRNRLKYLAAIPLILAVGMLCCSFYQTSPRPVHNSAKFIQSGLALANPDTTAPSKTNVVAPLPPPPPPVAPPPPPASSTKQNDEPAYTEVEKSAQFQGGDLNTFREWVQKNLVYPPVAVKNGIFGKIILQFAVNSHGKVCDIKVLRGVDPSLDNESIRVVQSSPDWVPAQQKGKNVKQQFVMPIIFQLQ